MLKILTTQTFLEAFFFSNINRISKLIKYKLLNLLKKKWHIYDALVPIAIPTTYLKKSMTMGIIAYLQK